MRTRAAGRTDDVARSHFDRDEFRLAGRDAGAWRRRVRVAVLIERSELAENRGSDRQHMPELRIPSAHGENSSV